MDNRQIAYLAALAVVTLLAWRQWRMTGILWANAAITLAALHGRDIGAIETQAASVYGAWGDFACGCALLSIRGPAAVIGFLYMPVAIWTIVAFAIGASSYDAYTFSYVIGYIQLTVVMVHNGRDGLGFGGRSNYRGHRSDGRVYRRRLLSFSWRGDGAALGLEKDRGK